MSSFRLSVFASLLLILSACSTLEAEPKETPPPALISELPQSVESFAFDSYRPFEDGSDGYSFRYSNPRKKRLADVYVYPVAEENRELPHNKLVLGSTRATIEAIGEAVRQGVYSNFNVINAGTRARGIRTVARVQATYLRENLASYTLVYQTEHDGTLLKIRISMPDNESNRLNGEWDDFAETVFNLIIDDLDRKQRDDSVV
ncbi:MAG: hypothetical protein V3U76_16210 [Granulosicoccus sp.]